MKILRFANPAADGRERLPGGIQECEFFAVSDSEGFLAEIDRGGYDAILIDFEALGNNHSDPVELARDHARDIPVVYFVDDADEVKAITAMDEGVADYVLTSCPQRLATVLRRACRQSAERRQGRLRLEACEDRAQHYHQLFKDSPCALLVIDATTTKVLEVNQAAVDLYGYTADEFCALSIAHFDVDAKAPVPRANLPTRQRHRCKDGRVIDVELITTDRRLIGRPTQLVWVNNDTARGQSEAENQRLKAEWEQRTRERTASLETTLKELEAFSYSVSHDLRGPLRGIDGFARAVLEDCREKLGPEGVRLIQVIRDETKRMTQLIDDLLAFSRVGRQHIDPSEIDMTELARSAFQNIVEASSSAAPMLDLQELPPARGDRSMLRQVFANLLENAVKFSSLQRAPRIEISGWTESSQHVYRVKDNGVGFDPRYAHKLFAVFQRLHSQEEFTGTGVGLALVQRIIQRHGGRVWAESTLHQGASFYFALPLRVGRKQPPAEPAVGS
jgi:PAS domain S-box-containing protein